MILDVTLLWQTIVTFIFGVLALRVAGRKSLARMTVAETVVMIAVGTILIEPLVGKDIWRTFSAVQFILLFGVVSALGDITYEGARSIYGPYLGFLGASATVIGLVTGIGEFLGYFYG